MRIDPLGALLGACWGPLEGLWAILWVLLNPLWALLGVLQGLFEVRNWTGPPVGYNLASGDPLIAIGAVPFGALSGHLAFAFPC